MNIEQIAKLYLSLLTCWLYPTIIMAGDGDVASGTPQVLSPPPNLEKRFEEMRLLMQLVIQETREEGGKGEQYEGDTVADLLG